MKLGLNNIDFISSRRENTGNVSMGPGSMKPEKCIQMNKKVIKCNKMAVGIINKGENKSHWFVVL